MGKREKWLVAFMVIALAYGAYELFSRTPELTLKDSAEAYVRTARNVTQEVSTNLEEAELSAKQIRILELSAEQWRNDPFYVLAENKNIPVEESSDNRETVRFIYSGYLEMGDVRMAIINGVEYREGQALEETGYIVRRISPRQVLIETSAGETISVFYKE